MQSFTFDINSDANLVSGYFYLDSSIANASLEVYNSDITLSPNSVDGNGGKYI